MPEIKKYAGKEKSKNESPKRRPHKEIQTEEDGLNTEALNEGVAAGATEQVFTESFDQEFAGAQNSAADEETPLEPGAFSADSTFDENEEKIHLDFYGSEILRAKAPKAMEIADRIADDWVKDGQFQGLPVGSPVAQVAASLALRKAKDVEKKLEENGVFAMAKMGFDFLKSKIDKKP